VDRFLAASSKTAALYGRLFGVPASRIGVGSQLGIDTVAFSAGDSLAHEGFVVGYSGQLEPHKGVTDLVEAVGALRAEGIDVVLHLIGAGSLAAQLVEKSHRDEWLRISGAVPRSEIPGFLRGLDLFALPSRILPDHEEHDAYALIEAMACGVPCVGTDSGAIPETLGDAGEIVPAGDVGRLTDTLRELVHDGTRRTRLSADARVRAVRHFDLSAVARDRTQMYRELLHDR